MPRICLSVIARDEAPRIARLLDSVADHVDEMLVADTGSRDATVAVARAHGARVIELAWGDDFAQARNACLDACGADWHLVLDADEWLLGGGEWLRALRAGAFGDGFVGRIELHNLDANGRMLGVERLSRLLPGALRYAGRVHEQPQHRLALRDVPLRVAHDGYASEAIAAKRGRNRALLRRATAEQPHDTYLWYQLGKDCAVYDDHAGAHAAFARVAEYTPTGARPPWWPDLVLRWLYVLQQAGRLDEALAMGDAHLRTLGGYPDLHFVLGNVWLDVAVRQPAQAPAALAHARTCWEQALRLGEHPALPHTVPGRGSTAPRHNLALLSQFGAA